MNFEKVFKLYITASKEATKAFLKNLIIIPAMIGAYLALYFLSFVASPLGLAGQLLMGLVFIAVISLYYGWLREAHLKQKLSWKDLIVFDYQLFSQVISVAFIFWIVFDLLLGSISMTTQNNLIRACAQLVAFIALNSIPEVLYLQNYEGISAINKSFQFTRDYWIEWFIPVLLLLAWPILTTPQEGLLVTLANSEPLLPFKLIFDTWPTERIAGNINLPIIGIIFSIIVPLAVSHWYMLLRSYIFDRIESGILRRSF